MPQPFRPFVPRLTPTKAQPAIASSDFAISPPFVAGADRGRGDAFRVETTVDATSPSASAIHPNEKFLEWAAPVAARNTTTREEDGFAGDLTTEEDELPPVEHFIDPLPSIEDFGAVVGSESDQVAAEREFTSDGLANAGEPEREWVETDWQQYDWRAAAAHRHWRDRRW